MSDDFIQSRPEPEETSAPYPLGSCVRADRNRQLPYISSPSEIPQLQPGSVAISPYLTQSLALTDF